MGLVFFLRAIARIKTQYYWSLAQFLGREDLKVINNKLRYFNSRFESYLYLVNNTYFFINDNFQFALHVDNNLTCF